MSQQGRKCGLPQPPHNPGLRDLVEAKRAGHSQSTIAEKRIGFSGWHERGYLPHRDAPGLTQFITFRLADAFPASLLSEWQALLQIEDETKRRTQLEAYLDLGRGNCWLQRPAIAELCENVLRHFHGERYELRAWCLMPNHGHVVVKVTNVPMSKIVKGWKGYTARRANQILARTEAEFWASDYWDTYMRDDEHERRTVHYTENNPVKAHLVRDAKEWPWSSARFRDEYNRLILPPLA